MTLQQKWDSIKKLINERTDAFVQSQTGLPTVFYQVTYNGQLKELPVLKVVHINTDQWLAFSGKKPNREDCRKIESIYYNQVCDEKYLRFIYDAPGNSYSLERIKEDKMLFLDKSEAEKLAKEITDRIAEEERLLANGHERCQRCRKVVPASEILTHTIIGRDRKPVWNNWKGRYEDKAVVTQEPMKFCGGECAGNEQMSREG
jgi:hypothetical protein